VDKGRANRTGEGERSTGWPPKLTYFARKMVLKMGYTSEYKRQAAHYLKQLADKVRRKRIKPTPEEVLDAISEWLAEIAAERTQMPHSIIRRVVLERVSTVGSPDFQAWLEHAEEVLT
jgi:hypothetical protein